MRDVITYKHEKYCDDCLEKQLEVVEERMFADNNTYVINQCVRCVNSDLCEQLWNHLLDYAEEHEDEEDKNDFLDEDDDWSYTADASYEDIH